MVIRLAALSLLLAPIIPRAVPDFTPISSSVAPGTKMQDTTTCLDTLRASDTVSAVVTIRVRPQNPKTTLPPDFEGFFAEEIRSRLKVLPSLPLSVMTGWNACSPPSPACAGAILMFGTQAYATAHSTGALSRIRVLDYLLVPAFSERVRAVLETISEEKMSPPFLNREDSIALNIGIGVQWQADTVPAHRRLFRIKLPRYNLPFSSAAWPKDAKAPIYPSIAETRGVSDSIAVTFTVLADGTVPTQSIEVQAGHNIEIIRAVYERLSTAKYLPGHVGGCAVASRGLQSFMFKMPGRR